MKRVFTEFLKDKPFSRFFANLAEYLLFVAGALSLLLMVLLLSLLQVARLPPELSEAVTTVLFLPFIMDLMLISPNLPVLLLLFFMVPLLLIIAVIFRILLARISLERILGTRSIAAMIPLIVGSRERKYGLATLLAVSLGATIGPSMFVLSPYSVKYYGWYALPGMILASASSVALAYGYSRMFYYSGMIDGKVVGGPSFVSNAFGTKHYLYIVSRFTMWIGNVALAAFNIFIAIELAVEHILPLALPGWIFTSYPALGLYARLLLFIALSLVVLVGYRNWERMVTMQSYLTLVFMMLVGLHIVLLPHYYSLDLGGIFNGLDANPNLLSNFVVGTLVSAAYVYLMVFGFQEVQSLAGNVKGGGVTREEKMASVYSVLKRAMVGGSILSTIIFCTYTGIYISLSRSGIEIPSTAIPSLDIARRYAPLYYVTLAAIILGVATTYIPAFVAALKHLRELLSDVFLVRIEDLKVKIDPYIVIFFMGLLLLTNSEYIVRLTDFAVLISLTIISFSEYALMRKVPIEARETFAPGYRIFLTAAMLGTAVAVLSATSQEVAINSVMFMLFSTLIIMFLSYDLILVELFALATGFLSMLIIPPLVGVVAELAGYGLATPTDIAIAQALTASIWILRFIFLALALHVTLQFKDEIIYMFRAAMNIVSRYL